jgi:cobalamin synthase
MATLHQILRFNTSDPAPLSKPFYSASMASNPVVNLVFGLIATATVTIIASLILK